MKNKVFLSLIASVAVAQTATVAQTVDTLLNSGILEPHSIVFGTDTTFYLTDSATHRVLQYDSKNGLLTTLAGVNGQGGTNNGPGFLARFVSPRGLVSARGGLIVADAGNHALRFLTLTGSVSVVSTFSGTLGQPGFVDGPLASALFNTPVGLAMDVSGNIFVADSKNNAIRKIDLANNVTTVSTNFFEPSGMAFDDSNQLLVADTKSHSIKIIRGNGAVEFFAGSTNKVAGTNDAYFASEALFNQPSGLIWLGGNTGLLVTDTGNNTLRRVYFDPVINAFFPELNGYVVETYAGVPRQAGLLDGALKTAKFNAPIGMTKDADGGLLVADLGNRALRRIQTTPKLPKVTDPQIGYVLFVEDERTGEIVSKISTFSDAVFNNEAIIAVKAEANTETFYTLGPTPALFEPDTLPAPNALNSLSAPPYSDGLSQAQVRPTILSPSGTGDFTIKAVSTAEGRRPSELVKVRVQFKASAPIIVGDNPASFNVSSSTSGATTWYTLDGSAPTNQAPSLEATLSTLSIVTNTPFVFRARAFRDGFKPSEIVTKPFSPTEFKANRISFGFERGEASSDFVASAGQRFFAPVTLTLLPASVMYSLQFNLLVTNLNGAPAVAPGQVGFSSAFMEKLPSGVFRTIPPAMMVFSTNPPPGASTFLRNGVPYQDLLFTNSAINLMGVGWLARGGITNELLFDVINQDLITYSQPHDTRFQKDGGKVVPGAYSFVVPGNAAQGQIYQIAVDRASATSDGIGGPLGDVFIDVPISGSLSNGTINSIKHVVVGQRKYVVGDAAPFRWFNAGDFGNNTLLNDDVMQIFQTAVHGLNGPIAGSDLFDAMDSCCGVPGVAPNPLFDGTDATINSITLGDGNLDVADIYVTFRRSLDPTLTWYRRYWSSGALTAEVTTNNFRGRPSLPAEKFSVLDADGDSTEAPSAFFSASDVLLNGEDVLTIPLSAHIHGKYAARICMANIEIEPLEGSPALTEAVEFTPNPNLGQPTLSNARHLADFGGAWLNKSVAGLRGNTQLGTLRVKLPPNLPPSAAYRVRFAHVSASPNGISVLPQGTQDGLLLSSARDGSCFDDGIPDTWRLRYFGSIGNLLSHAQADADGDGVSNWAEFKAGTNPSDLRSHLRMKANVAAANSAPQGIVLRWPTGKGKLYAIEAANSITTQEWTPVAANVIGTGAEMQFTAPDDVIGMQFFRVRLVE